MRSFSTVDVLRDFKSVSHAAAREPVAITQHRKVRFVMMAVEDFEQLSAARSDPRRVIRADQTPPELAEIFAPALDAMIEAGDTDDE
jgi:PHD/YefM family antitoxin component YafN of YafNO toxin-antitoxin module